MVVRKETPKKIKIIGTVALQLLHHFVFCSQFFFLFYWYFTPQPMVLVALVVLNIFSVWFSVKDCASKLFFVNTCCPPTFTPYGILSPNFLFYALCPHHVWFLTKKSNEKKSFVVTVQ